ncbi:siroheme synthase domain protein [Leptospira fainei serovar Hurstbridge str. BUT 6]|uniref:precorrin-2 dehydrogenase n=1 Tax=Leptospira fainei serovar Hurstbridge str. BUT 6 TaxID=1193011 RepID=S3UUJ8_9LEPT|nr:bifunctional precorrin-2 dehydrogenase/sirohydrochlorin ferrochelatase [Leptospira fainei]EPG74081.1 siroheme synthase domain protein [Leptospira fainei serovar Hurstbridge str. BUT 6]
MNGLLPVFLKLEGKNVLLVGAGKVALEKLGSLLGTGCRLTVLAREIHPDVSNLLADRSDISLIQKSVELSDLAGFQLIYSATNDREINQRLVLEAKRLGIWINCADDPESCDFYSAAFFDRGPLRVAVSTQGEFAGLSGTVRTILEELLPVDHEKDLVDLFEIRKITKQRLGDPETRKIALRELLQEFREKYLKAKIKN